MTSANSSWAKFWREQRSITMRRLPLAALSILCYFLYDVFGTAMEIQRERSVGSMGMTVEAAVRSFPVRGAQIVSQWMGFRSIGWFIACVGAVLLAIQGFSYLYRSQTVDFYESRPEKRSTRFANIVLNGFFIYMIPSLLGVLIAFLLALASGCGFGWVLAEMLLTWVFHTVMFLAVYAMSLLASLLTGTVVTAVLMNAYFFGIEVLLRLTMLFHRSAYYATFEESTYDNPMNRVWSLPPYHYLKSLVNAGVYDIPTAKYNWGIVRSSIPQMLPGALINLVIFVLFLIAAYLVYRARRAEDAGKAVIFDRLAVFIKASASILFSLCTGLFVYWLFGQRKGPELTAVIMTIVLTVFVLCILLEAIFGLNIRMAFRRLWQVPVIAAVALFVLFVYRMDLFGYDRWIPKGDQVESAWLSNDSGARNYYSEEGNYISVCDHARGHMFLTDIEDMRALATISQATMVERQAMDDPWEEECFGWYATVGWRMKNGKVYTRNMFIPETVDPAMMDRIIGTPEYIRGFYQYADDPAAFRRLVESENMYSTRKYTLSARVITEHGSASGSGELLEDFLEVYLKDLDKHYNYTLASSEHPVGAIDFEVSGIGYYSLEYPIFEAFSDTIAFLDAHDLWRGGFLTPDEVDRVRLYIDRWDEETEIWNDIDEYYTDRAHITELMEVTRSTTYSSAWDKTGDREPDFSASLTIFPMESQYPYENGMQRFGTDVSDDGEYGYPREFIRGRVPAYVKAMAE